MVCSPVSKPFMWPCGPVPATEHPSSVSPVTRCSHVTTWKPVAQAGFTSEVGFVEFVASLADGDDQGTWRHALANSVGTAMTSIAEIIWGSDDPDRLFRSECPYTCSVAECTEIQDQVRSVDRETLAALLRAPVALREIDPRTLYCESAVGAARTRHVLPLWAMGANRPHLS